MFEDRRMENINDMPQQTGLKLTSEGSRKSLIDAYILTIVLGALGVHHFYLGRPWFFLAYFVTFGLFGVGWLVDICRIPWLVEEANATLKNPKLHQQKTKMDAYVLWFPCGLLGFHLFYLKRPGLGLLYLFTLGLFGIGWLLDGFRIPDMVRECNANPDMRSQKKNMAIAYMFTVSPLGILGAHYYYLEKPCWGILYSFTFGLCGFGWIADWFRCYWLVKRYEAVRLKEIGPDIKYLDELYLLWFPLGWLGLHHFYLERYGWGLLYFTTLGLAWIGWLVDLFRLHHLVAEYNQVKLESEFLCTKTKPGLIEDMHDDWNGLWEGGTTHNEGIKLPSYEEAVASETDTLV